MRYEYPSFQYLLLWSTFHTHTNYGYDKGIHQSDLGADGDVLLVPNAFSLATAAVVWAIVESTLGLDPPSDTLAPKY